MFVAQKGQKETDQIYSVIRSCLHTLHLDSRLRVCQRWAGHAFSGIRTAVDCDFDSIAGITAFCIFKESPEHHFVTGLERHSTFSTA